MDSIIAFLYLTTWQEQLVYVDYDSIESFRDHPDTPEGSIVRTKTGQEIEVKETTRQIMDGFLKITQALG